MAKRIINEYAARSPGGKSYQRQMRRMYISRINRFRRSRIYGRIGESSGDVADDLCACGIDESSADPDGYAEECIFDAGKDLATYSRKKVVAAGKRITERKAVKRPIINEKVRRMGYAGETSSEFNSGRNSADDAVQRQEYDGHSSGDNSGRKNNPAYSQGYRDETEQHIERGRRAFQRKSQSTAAVRHPAGNTWKASGSAVNSAGNVKNGVYSAKNVAARISASARVAYESVSKAISSLAAIVGGSTVAIIVVSIVLVATLALCSSFGVYGLEPSDNDLVNIALTQVGTESGEEYWSWYGFDHEVGWCACFVSWCANEAGMIDAGTMPKFAWVPTGVYWFQARDQWLDGSVVPEPGMIIFFDWYDDTLDEEGEPIGQDGEADHVGIVEKVEDGHVYTVEGNTTEEGICTEKKYTVGYHEILGFGCPEF